MSDNIPTVGQEPPPAPPLDPSEPAPEETDNSARDGDGDQTMVSQDPNTDLTEGESL